jgi:hypothetical protein
MAAKQLRPSSVRSEGNYETRMSERSGAEARLIPRLSPLGTGAGRLLVTMGFIWVNTSEINF